MNAVDCSDQLLATNNVNRESMRWRKALFFQLIDIAVVNSFLLFREHQSNFSDNEALQRTADYSLAHFCEEIVQDICGFEEFMNPPVSTPVADPHDFETAHVPVMTAERKIYGVCYKQGKGEQRVQTKYSAPQGDKYTCMHITQNKNCFQIFHTRAYQKL